MSVRRPHAEANISFATADLRGVAAADAWWEELPEELPRLLDAAAARETLHWGRNYVFVVDWPTPGGGGKAVVKQFRHDSLKARLRRAMRGSKAELSWSNAHRLASVGVTTPAPLLVAESKTATGPSFYVSRFEEGVIELRYPLRAARADTFEADFPSYEAVSLLRAVGGLARRLHEANCWFRDFTSGNVLLRQTEEGLALSLVDLNRARFLPRVSAFRRMRDLSRMPIERPQDQDAYLAGYAPEGLSRTLRSLYRFAHGAFNFRNRAKGGVRGFGRRIADVFLPRRSPHPHIPPPPETSSIRDKTVWDGLSDQPHQHATRSQKLRTRIADLPSHVHSNWTAARALVRARSRYRELREESPQETEFRGLGVAVRPEEGDPLAPLPLLERLSVPRVLLRLHLWQEEQTAEIELARALRRAGYDLTLVLAQNRSLVRTPELWSQRLARVARDFGELASTFQIGHAPNRSKWGVWTLEEYVELFSRARRALPAGARLLGPAVIDFEFHSTAAFLNRFSQELRFDAVASLLYVDRRGAPENRQLGFDSLGKVALLRALIDTCRNNPGVPSWITEVNWPLREGPHSPAGRDVAVSEEQQADYLTRFLVPVLASGWVERVYWWQLIARGYGLVTLEGSELCERPSFRALRQLGRRCEGARVSGPRGDVPTPGIVYDFVGRDGAFSVGWSTDEASVLWRPAAVVDRVEDRSGEALSAGGDGRGVALGPSPKFVWLSRDRRGS